jgi:SAM-dependent methyltransferase
MSGFARGAAGLVDPIAGPVPRSALARGWWRLKHRVRRVLGTRRGFKVEGVYYKETSPELLWRALSRKGSGSKEYRVTFPDGSKMLIHCTLRRPYADVMGSAAAPHYQRAQGMLRPGMRVLAVPSGTGSAVKWLAERVGPSGAVVALDTDEESVAYGQKRYARPNVAFEGVGAGSPGGGGSGGVGGALAGEVDGAFDAGFVVSADPAALSGVLLREVWRVIAPGGWVLLGCPSETARVGVEGLLESVRMAAEEEEAEDDGEGDAGGASGVGIDWLSTSEDAYHVVLVRKLGVEAEG